MPSLFGIGIGMLLSLDVAMAMFLGGVIKAVALWVYARGKSGDELAEAKRRGGDDTMVVGASVFAAAAVLSIGLVVLDIVFGYVGWQPWYLAH
jgi:uncharacterized oligopeptide transporter (OPT) family protein